MALMYDQMLMAAWILGSGDFCEEIHQIVVLFYLLTFFKSCCTKHRTGTSLYCNFYRYSREDNIIFLFKIPILYIKYDKCPHGIPMSIIILL